MSKSAVVITPALEASVIDIAQDELSKLQKAVDGYIEAVVVASDVVMWVNEEFVFRPDLQPNIIGSALYSEIGGNRPIFGTVVLTGGTDPEGYTIGLSEADVAEMLDIVEQTRKAFTE
jgi:hypothetical protein